MQHTVHITSDAGARAQRIPLSDGSAPDHVEIGDTQFLFTAHFKKAGPDLILTGDDGHKLVLVDYFNLPTRPDLTSHGATMSADLVARLAGPDAPGQYAQAGAPAGAQVVGKCERLTGGATVQHANGVVEELKLGDAVLKGDVVMTSDGSAAVLSLIDGTVFNMGASARMVLNELVYDPNSTSNSALFSLVKGAFTFVGGHVAHTGDMKVDTPVATMGIRGTTVSTNIEADPSGSVYSVTFSLMVDHDGHVGPFQVLDRVTGVVLGTVNTTTNVFSVNPTAATQLQEAAKSPAQVQTEIAAAQVLFPVFQAVAATIAPPAGAPPPTGPQQGPNNNNPNGSPPGGSTSTEKQVPQVTSVDVTVNVADKVVPVSVTAQPSPTPAPQPTTPAQLAALPDLPALNDWQQLLVHAATGAQDSPSAAVAGTVSSEAPAGHPNSHFMLHA
jgi:FecR protein